MFFSMDITEMIKKLMDANSKNDAAWSAGKDSLR
jgi:hypothetical protein